MGQDQSKPQQQNNTILKENTNISNALYPNNNVKNFNQLEIDLINLQKQKFQGQSISYSTNNKENKENFLSPKSSEMIFNITTPNQQRLDKVFE